MKKVSLDSTAVVYDSFDELSEEDQLLLQKAIAATKTSYAPYSNFKVGACVYLENGQYITGSNQENAAYPSGICAERVAVWKAGTDYPGVKILKIGITATSEHKDVDKPVGPCGACRQSMLEYEVDQKEPIKVLFMGEVGKVVAVSSVTSLLPFSFDGSYLS